jgi:hypothetical protein
MKTTTLPTMHVLTTNDSHAFFIASHLLKGFFTNLTGLFTLFWALVARP